MKIQLSKGLYLLIAPVLLASCAGPGVKLLTQPLTDNPVVGTLLNSSKLTPETRTHLEEEGVLPVYRKDRPEAVRILEERLAENPSHERRLALIELCSNTGDQLASSDGRRAVGYHLAAAELAYEEKVFDAASKSERKELVAAYNHSCGQVAKLLFSEGYAWDEATEMAGPAKTYRLRSRTKGKGYIDPTFFDRMEPANLIQFENIDLERVRLEGIGGAMVGHRNATPERRKANPFMPTVGMAMPVNATLEYSRGGAEVELAFHDLLIRDEARIGGETVPLAGDLTAPIVVLTEFEDTKKIGMQGLRNPDKYIDAMGLYGIQPFREDQIPVVFVHGLMSSPYTWLSAINQCRKDPQLREKYQLYAIRYPTGFPIAYNAAAVRQRLKEFQERFDPGRRNPNMRKMIIIGHSMGGMLSNMQIRSSGDSFTRLLFDRPIDEIAEMDQVQKEAIKDLLLYDANPDITRAVFVASPHRGSGIASSPLGNLGIKLIKFPLDILTVEPLPEMDALTESGREIIRSRPSSISNLKPDSPGPRAVLTQPIRSGVTIHSIIGRAKPSDPLLKSSDKVVPYTSAHLDVAVSEKVVHATHTTILSNPDAIEEMRRILYLHAGLPYHSSN